VYHGLRKRGTRVTADGARPLSAVDAKDLFADLASAPALVLAVSGGPDSIALLILAARWRAARKRGPKLLAVTIDHGLRAESAAEAKHVARLARRLGVAHRTLHWTGKKPKTGLQEKAREARYRLLAQAGAEAGASHLLTAHTVDDQAETVLMRLLRGSGPAGLGGMAPTSPLPWPSSPSPPGGKGDGGPSLAASCRNRLTQRSRSHVPASGINLPPAMPADLSAQRRGEKETHSARSIILVRPFLDVPKARLIATLRAAGIPFAEDPSNMDLRFTRVRLRSLMEGLAPEGLTTARLALLAQRMRRVEAALAKAVDQAASDLSHWPWPKDGPVELDVRGFAALPAEVSLRLLGRAAAQMGNEGPVELGKLETLHAALTGAMPPHGRFRRTLAGAMVTLTRDRLMVEPAPARHGRTNTLTTGRRAGHKALK
jgi:tRNA(Ile)-lysidine synthase